MSLNVHLMRQEKVQALLSRAQYMETPLTGATLQVGSKNLPEHPHPACYKKPCMRIASRATSFGESSLQSSTMMYF